MGGISQATRGFLEAGGSPPPAIISTDAPDPNTVVLTWSQSVSLTPFGGTNAARTIVPPPGGTPVDVTAVVLLDPTHVQLTTTDQESGASYELDVPQSVVVNGAAVANAATAVFFTGNNVALTVAGYRLVDSTDLIVTFSRAVQTATATIPGNYVFVPPLAVNQAVRVTDKQYLLKTAVMVPSTIYTVTVSNVKALDGSVI